MKRIPLEKMTFKELKAEVRRMVRKGELTEKELIAFIRSRRLNGKNYSYPKAEVRRTFCSGIDSIYQVKKKG